MKKGKYMKWVTMAVKADFGWPTVETEIEYLGCKYVLRPESEKDAQSVSLFCPHGSTMESSKLLINRFLSSLAWSEGKGITELFTVGSNGPNPTLVGKSQVMFVSHKFRADYLPEPNDEKSLRALALYREALSVNSRAYSFLGFFKVLNILFATGKDQKDWLNNNLPAIKGYDSTRRLEILKNQHEDIGEYLYTQGRCAIAHAFNNPVVDPDIPTEVKRLSEDLSLMKEFAEIAIENELEIISRNTYHSMHLYELEGFEQILGPEIVTLLKEGALIPEGANIEFPSLSVRLRDSVKFPTLENLKPSNIIQHEGLLIIHLRSNDNVLQLVVILDFSTWRLIFDPINHVTILDNGLPISMYARSDIALFTKGQYTNGQVEIYNSETDVLLARTDPFIPHNINLMETVKNLESTSNYSLQEASKREKKQTEDKTRVPEIKEKD